MKRNEKTMKDTKRAKVRIFLKKNNFTNTLNPQILRFLKSYTKKITRNNLTS